jgi:hypothetical protein
MSDSLTDRAAGVWRRAVDSIRDRLRARQTMRDINALDSGEASRVLAEAGLTKADLRDVMSRPFPLDDLMSRGMVSVGIDADEFAVRNADWFQAMQRDCALCGSRGRCREIILRSEFAQHFRSFCPNSREFDEILAAKARGGPSSAAVLQAEPAYLDYVI